MTTNFSMLHSNKAQTIGGITGWLRAAFPVSALLTAIAGIPTGPSTAIAWGIWKSIKRQSKVENQAGFGIHQDVKCRHTMRFRNNLQRKPVVGGKWEVILLWWSCICKLGGSVGQSGV
jgi:hypothetical protein